MIFRIVLLFMLALFHFSCSDFLKGKPKKNDTIEVSKESLNCMNEVSDKLKTVLDSKANDKDIDKAFECIDSTMKEFQTRVDGRADANSFTTEEMQQIFDKFMKGTKITPEATRDLMVLKAALFGGSSDKISKKEISDLRKYLDSVKAETKALMPYVQLFKFQKENTMFSKKMLQEGFGQLNLSLKNLFKGSQIYRSDYQFADLQKLIFSLNIIDQERSGLLALAGKIKNLFGGSQALLSESDYLTFIDNLTEALRLYSFHIQGYVQFAMEKPEVLNDTIEYVENWVSLLENSLQFKRSKIISVETLDPLISEISEKGLFPIAVKTETLLLFYKLIIVRAFDAGPSADVAAFSGINKGHISRIKREIAIYKIYLQSISEVNPIERVKLSVIQQKLRTFKPKKFGWLSKFDENSKKMILDAFEELKNEYLSPRPVLYRDKKMVIAANQEIWDQNWQDLARAAYVKMLARELMLGWGQSTPNKLVMEASLNESQLVQWYNDFKQFGIEIKTFDPRSVNSGAVTFKQANLLTYSGDGDDKMNFLETAQYLNMLLSGGGQTTSEMVKGFEIAKCQLTDQDVFGNFWLEEKCVIRDLRLNSKKYFSSLSYMSGYLNKLTEKEFAEFYSQVMDVTRVNPQMKGQRVETADIRNMSILFNYIESLFAVYDANRNWTFSASEVRNAYPRFKNFATKFAYDQAKPQIDQFNGFVAQRVGGYGCFSEQDLIQEAFIFLVFTGKPPQSSDLNWFPCTFERELIDFSGEVDRSQIINTFKILKSVLGS